MLGNANVKEGSKKTSLSCNPSPNLHYVVHKILSKLASLNTSPIREILRRTLLQWHWPVEGTEWRFDKQLGPHVRRWSYCYLLFDQCSYNLLTQGAPLLERIFALFLMPFLRRIVFSALYCNKAGAKERSLQVVETIFKEVVVNPHDWMKVVLYCTFSLISHCMKTWNSFSNFLHATTTVHLWATKVVRRF